MHGLRWAIRGHFYDLLCPVVVWYFFISLYNLYLYISLFLCCCDPCPFHIAICPLLTSWFANLAWFFGGIDAVHFWLVTAGNLGGVQLYIRYIRHSKIIRPSLLRWHNGMFIIIILSSLSCHNHRIG